MMSYVAGALGILMFIWGFLKWLSIGDNDKESYAGYAFGTPTTAVIGLSLAAGLLALLGATERRPGRGVPSAIPTALAATSLLLAIGILISKGSISPDHGAEVGAKIGLILGLITAALQTIVLGAVLAGRKDDAADTSGGAYAGGSTGYANQPYQPAQQAGYAPPAPGGYSGSAGPTGSTGVPGQSGTPGY
jgi:Family of unknown function (DUF5336)